MKFTLSFALLLFISTFSFAESNFEIKNFLIKSTDNNKIGIEIIDSLEIPKDNLNGTYNFIFNGFKKTLLFKEGSSETDMEIEKSAFLYIKHENHEKNVSKLFYVLKTDNGFKPISISWYLLLIIPGGLILMGYMFRRLIGFVIFILLGYLYFTYSKGLPVSGLLETIFDGLKNAIF